MATKNFTQFSTAAPLTTGDYVVGYKQDGSAEFKATVQQIVDLVGEIDSQTLSFNEGTKDLSITNGNTVSLSALVDSSVDTGVRALTSNWESTYTNVQSNSGDWNYQGTDIKSLTSNWESTYTTYNNNSGYYVSSNSTLETPTTGLSTVNNIVSLSQATYDALTVKLPTTMYVIV